MGEWSIKCSGRARGAAHWSGCSVACNRHAAAPLCCREAAGNIRSLPYMQTTLMFIQRDTSQPVPGSLQPDGPSRTTLNLRASAYNTQGGNHLWQPSVQTQMGLLPVEEFSPFPVKLWLNQTHDIFFTLTAAGGEKKTNTCTMCQTRLQIRSRQRIKHWILTLFKEAILDLTSLSGFKFWKERNGMDVCRSKQCQVTLSTCLYLIFI